VNQQRTVHLAVYDTLADWEPGHAIAHINAPWWQPEPRPFRVQTVAETADPITTAGGLRILPDLTLARMQPEDSAMLILPGAGIWGAGGGEPFTRTARQFLAAGVPVAAICGATFGLARDGLLDDRPHTSSAPEYLAASGYTGAAHYRDEPVVTDGDLITAGPTNPVDFARAIFERLAIFTDEQVDAWYRLFNDSDPDGFAVLSRASREQPAPV
jgi:putative intracellular protease/amidase